MSAQFIFTMYKVGRVVPPEREVLKDISLSFYPGAKIGVIGPNGSGKSTLLRIMAGIDDGYTGEARLSPGFTVGMLEQEPKLDESKDVTGNVMDGVAETAKLLTDYDELMAGWADPDADYEALGAQQADLEAKIEAAGAWDLKRTVEIAMDALRLPPGDADVASLSGGEARRVALCRLLLKRPDLLLLDEPTNHLDAESVAWIERFLADYEGTVVAITHDRYFLDNVASWILELDHGKGMPFEGNYSGWLEQKQARLAKEEKHASTRQRTLERELEWVRMAPKARQAKSKARLAAYDQLLAEQQAAKGASDGLEIYIPPGDRLGDQVIEVDHLTKGFGDKLLIDDLTFSLPKAGIVGVIGPNGAGKTTLFRMLVEAGEQATAAPDAQPDSGEIRVGSTVQMAHVDQHRDQAVGVERQEPGLLLLQFAEVDGTQCVGQLQFLERDGYLVAVRGRRGKQLDHVIFPVAPMAARQPGKRQSLVVLFEQRLQCGERRVRGPAAPRRAGTGVTTVGFDLLLVFVVVAIDTEQFPVAAVGRIVVVVVIPVVHSEFAHVGPCELAGATAADTWIDLQGLLAIALLAGFGGSSRLRDDAIELARI